MRKQLIQALIFLAIRQAGAQAYFNGTVKEALKGASLNNVKIMVVNARDTSYFNVGSDGSYNITTKEGKNKIFAIADGYVTELNSIDAAKGSTNKIDISMVEVKTADLDSKKRARFEKSSAEMHEYEPSGAYSRKADDIDGYPAFRSKSLTLGFHSGRSYITPGAPVAAVGAAGKLTAGSILDFGKWRLWKEMSVGQFLSISKIYRFHFAEGKRFVVQVASSSGIPVIDAPVALMRNGVKVWSARTDNTGKAELWFNAFVEGLENGKFSAEANAFGKTYKAQSLSPAENGINFITADGPCSISDQLDVAFVVDATGSMGDEIHYLKKDLDTFIKTISMRSKEINLRLGSVFYRDQGDEYVYRISPFSSNTTITDNFIIDQAANGGGDYPEAMEVALGQAVNNMAWSSQARARIIFFMLDAPCHQDQGVIDSLHRYIALAAEKGIRIVPIACSGTDKNTEFIMRSAALLTNGKYLFLTNHSGIGNSHIEPSTDIYSVRSLLDEMLAVTTEFSAVPECEKGISKQTINQIDSIRMTENPLANNDSLKQLILSAEDSARLKDSLIVRERGSFGAINWVKIWPNPTEGPLKIKIEADIREVYIADISGKLIQRLECKKGDLLEPNLGNYSSGIYFVKYPTAKGWVGERIVLRR